VEYIYLRMRNHTYGFDLTPLIFLAHATGDKEWLEQLYKRYMRDRKEFPSFYERKRSGWTGGLL
jgi:hypothetical protein